MVLTLALLRAQVFDNYSCSVMVDGTPLTLGLWDTAGQEEYDRLRSLSYPQTDVFLVCFSLISSTSLCNLISKWIPEITLNAPKAKIVLVGTKEDLLHDAALIEKINATGKPIADEQQAAALAASLNTQYVRCSALTQRGLKKVFDTAVRAVLAPPPPPAPKIYACNLLAPMLTLIRRTKKDERVKNKYAPATGWRAVRVGSTEWWRAATRV